MMPKQVLGAAASSEEILALWQRCGDSIPSRPAYQPGLDLSQVITIVTGLPRSGTSMVMQMLEAGGLPPLADQRRSPDAGNPRGYYEFEKVKRLRTDVAWLPESKGKAIKIIAQLLPALPKNRYRLIYVDRDLNEIVQSQRAMLNRSGKRGGKLTEKQLKDVFLKQVRAIGEMLTATQIPIIKIHYGECIVEPTAAAAEINRFLGGRLNEPAMAAVVDARLYRQRKTRR